MTPEIYFDNAATTKVDEKTVEAMLPYFTKHYGNASSQHLKGIDAKGALEKSRRTIAKSIRANPDEIFFTSGGTEGNNLTLKGLFFQNYPEKDHIITTKIEHDCVLNSCKWLEKQGAKVTYLSVDKEGFVNPEELKNSITEKTIVVSIIHGNNEIGTIQDLKKLGSICQEKNTLFHTDACQSHTKTDINVKKQNVDIMTLNSHKIHGPKGVGALYIKQGIKINANLHGGGQEKNIRSGTENIPGIVGFAYAVEVTNNKYVKQMTKKRDTLIEGLLKIENVTLNGPKEKRLCNNINISFNNIEGEAIGGHLEDLGICTSTGSACMSNTLSTSHVLKALGHEPLQSNSSLRISISKYTTDEEVEYFLTNIVKVVEKLRKISPVNNTGDWI
ncbi:cysteine desulfurase [Candidatus Pacearchaeota archaeon]|nr:cysteine desulfurase [Candidatus Pacearchaeota archaeon]